MTTSTPGTPATTEPVGYVDRDGDVWLRTRNPDGALVEAGPIARWQHPATVESNYGPLVPLVREDVVAAREAAARDGRDLLIEQLASALNAVDESETEIARLRAEVAAAVQLRDLAREQYERAVTDGFKAAEQRGAEKALRDTLTWLIQNGVASEITNHLLATLFALGAAAVAGPDTPCAACGAPNPDGPVSGDGEPWCGDCYAEASASEATP